MTTNTLLSNGGEDYKYLGSGGRGRVTREERLISKAYIRILRGEGGQESGRDNFQNIFCLGGGGHCHISVKFGKGQCCIKLFRSCSRTIRTHLRTRGLVRGDFVGV